VDVQDAADIVIPNLNAVVGLHRLNNQSRAPEVAALVDKLLHLCDSCLKLSLDFGLLGFQLFNVIALALVPLLEPADKRLRDPVLHCDLRIAPLL